MYQLGLFIPVVLTRPSIVVIKNKLLKEGGTAAEQWEKKDKKPSRYAFDDPWWTKKSTRMKWSSTPNCEWLPCLSDSRKDYGKSLTIFCFTRNDLCFMTNVYAWMGKLCAWHPHHVKVVLKWSGRWWALFGGYSPYEDLYLAGMIREKSDSLSVLPISQRRAVFMVSLIVLKKV